MRQPPCLDDSRPGSPEADGEGGEGFYGAQSGRRSDVLASPLGGGRGYRRGYEGSWLLCPFGSSRFSESNTASFSLVGGAMKGSGPAKLVKSKAL